MDIPTPVRPIGTHFYRYSSLESPERLDWLRTILLDHEIYVPSVSQLNDPTEGRPLLAPMSEDQMFDFLHDPNRNPTLTVAAQQTIFEILRHNIRLHGPEELRRKMAALLYKELEAYRIYSLSKRYDNLNLWAKYADSHSGYCLGLFMRENSLTMPRIRQPHVRWIILGLRRGPLRRDKLEEHLEAALQASLNAYAHKA
jgi:hypothetical protein